MHSTSVSFSSFKCFLKEMGLASDQFIIDEDCNWHLISVIKVISGRWDHSLALAAEHQALMQAEIVNNGLFGIF